MTNYSLKFNSQDTRELNDLRPVALTSIGIKNLEVVSLTKGKLDPLAAPYSN